MSDNEQRNTDTIFLFGAGASVDAGIPDTYTFVSEFEEYINQHHSDFRELLSSIVKIRKKFNQRINDKDESEVDIEQLLDTIRRLIERENEPLLDFYTEKRFSLNVEQNKFTKIKDLLENFIRERVIIEDESKLEYLKELLKFDKPIEIYSTNYDTCIEQLSHIHHMRYTDGFSIYWDEANFRKNFDIKHYKMHGSVIWYENAKTKECVKIPVHGFLENKPIALKMIYGEDVKPLLIYPAQKSEYVEPLTDLQLKFKERLLNAKTKFVVVVGYSFRDGYVIHMLWDAARINEDLHVILISPNAQEIFDSKLKYINKTTGALSRLSDRVICLPYPFSTVIYSLKNLYLTKLSQILRTFGDILENERSGGEPAWDYLVKFCLESNFITKAEIAFQKANKKWQDLEIGTKDKKMFLSFKGLLLSVICEDGNEDKWIKRVNVSFEAFNVEKMFLKRLTGIRAFFGLEFDGNQVSISDFLKSFDPIINEKRRQLELLTPKFEKSLKKIKPSLDKLEEFYKRLGNLANGVVWGEYKVEKRDTPEIKSLLQKFDKAEQRGHWISPEPSSLILGVEKGRLRLFLEGESFKFELS